MAATDARHEWIPQGGVEAMPSACHHPGTLDRRDDGAHCPRCDALIYPARARTTEPPPGPAEAAGPGGAHR